VLFFLGNTVREYYIRYIYEKKTGKYIGCTSSLRGKPAQKGKLSN
jgi:hypothetical protein